MKYYNRKATSSILFMLSGLLFVMSSILQLNMGNYEIALLNALVTILLLFDVYIYNKPYLGLGEGKLLINQGILKKEILARDINSITKESQKRLEFTYSHGTSTKKQKIVLSMLKDNDRKQFPIDLHSLLGF